MARPNIPPYRMPLINPDRSRVVDDRTGRPLFQTYEWNEGPQLDHMEFPKMMYHRTKDAVIIQNQAEQNALGEEWAEKPFRVERPRIGHQGLQVPQAAQPAAANPLANDPDYKAYLEWKAFQAGKAVAQAEAKPPTAAPETAEASEARRQSLIREAEERRVDVDRRWGISRLEEALAKAAAA